MRILLVQSYLGRREKPIYPLGLAYLCGTLKEYDYKAIDLNISSDPIGDLKSVIKNFHPEIVGISLRNTDTTQIRDPFVYLSGFEATLNVVKERVPEAGIVVGGSGFSIYAKEILARYSQIDCGVFLEGEETFPELVANWGDAAEVKGIFLRKDGEIKFTGDRSFPNVLNLPAPDWEAIPLMPYRTLLDAVGVQTKRGCGLKCAYCNYPFLNGNYYRYRTPEAVGEEIERLVKDYKVERFIFVDSVFNIPREHAKSVLREMIGRKIKVKWTGWYNEQALDKDLVELAVEAGCELFSFSPDGFSDSALKALGKNLQQKDIIRVNDLLKTYHQAMVGYNFFLNPPAQSFWDLVKLLWFSFKVRLTFRGRLCGFLLGSIRIEPDTPIYHRAIAEGLITENSHMLATDSKELKRLFYYPPNSLILTLMLKCYIFLRSIRLLLFPVK